MVWGSGQEHSCCQTLSWLWNRVYVNCDRRQGQKDISNGMAPAPPGHGSVSA